jgi:uncharacterized protein YndB with AHSA1/START domain
MPGSEVTMTIARPMEEVFGYMTDFANVERWEVPETHARKTSPGPTGVGTTAEWTQPAAPHYDGLIRATVVEYEPPRLFTMRMETEHDGTPVVTTLRWRFEDEEKGTRVRYAFEINDEGFDAYLGAFPTTRELDPEKFIAAGETRTRTALENLKRLLEEEE